MFPADWKLGQAEIDEAQRICPHWSPEEIADQFERLRDKSLASGRYAFDWSAAWRAWCRDGKDYNPHRPQRSNGSRRRQEEPNPAQQWRQQQQKQEAVQDGFDAGWTLRRSAEDEYDPDPHHNDDDPHDWRE
jgi:hypothetical protein